MKKLLLGTSVMVLAALAAQKGNRAELQLEAAVNKEVVAGDLQGAIELYRKAAQSSDRAVAAQALVRMGQCYERLGDAEARKAYERVVREFGDQKDLAATARTRLAALERAGGLGHPPGIALRKVWAIDHGWLEAAPSPDGRYHSYVDWDTGDLFLRDLATGEKRRLTNDGTWDGPPAYAEFSVFSGDGRQIAYAWRNKEQYYELRVIGVDGSNQRTVFRDKEIGSYTEPYQWTADGKQILALLMRSKQEWQFAFIPAADGPRRVLKTPTPRAWRPSLSPDERFLAYAGPGKVAGGQDDIFLLSLESGQEIPLVQSPADDFNPVWTPAGNQILFVSDRTGTRGFWTIDVVDGKPRGIPRLVKEGVTVAGGRVIPGGFTRRGDFYYSTNTGIGEVYLAELDPVDGMLLHQPAPAVPRFAGSNSAPSWSPDGRRLAYYRRGDTHHGRPPTLVILSVETGEAKDVPVKLNQSAAPVIWRPDGKSVLVRTITSNPDALTPYWVDLETGEHRLFRSYPLPIPGGGDISPDGKKHYHFTSGEPKLRGGVIETDIETGKEREIARVPELAQGGFPLLKISPDSRQMALWLPLAGDRTVALRLAPATGGEWRELCRFPKSETEGLQQIAWTPDSRYLLTLRRTGKDGAPELWRISVAGGEPQRTGLSVAGMELFAPHPDGKRIAFDTGRSGAPNELWVLENLPAAAK